MCMKRPSAVSGMPHAPLDDQQTDDHTTTCSAHLLLHSPPAPFPPFPRVVQRAFTSLFAVQSADNQSRPTAGPVVLSLFLPASPFHCRCLQLGSWVTALSASASLRFTKPALPCLTHSTPNTTATVNYNPPNTRADFAREEAAANIVTVCHCSPLPVSLSPPHPTPTSDFKHDSEHTTSAKRLSGGAVSLQQHTPTQQSLTAEVTSRHDDDGMHARPLAPDDHNTYKGAGHRLTWTIGPPRGEQVQNRPQDRLRFLR